LIVFNFYHNHSRILKKIVLFFNRRASFFVRSASFLPFF